MKKIKLIATAVALMGASIATSQASITLGFESTSGATIDFTGGGTTAGGGQFKFLAGTDGKDFVINNSTVSPSGLGDLGLITSTFTIGTITGNSAPVTGTGTVSISDGSAVLTADLTWDTIATMGTSGTINVNGIINLTDIMYTGTQVALEDLAAAGTGIDTVSFTFIPGKTLAQLSATKTPLKTGYTGTIASSVPEPTTIVAGLLVLLPTGASTLQILRKKRAA